MQFPSLGDVEIVSVSYETEYEGGLILMEISYSPISQIHNVYRAFPSFDEDNRLYDVELTKLFILTNVQQDIKMVEVFDEFALLIDLDDAVHVAIRPDVMGGEAIYSVPPVKGITTNFLYLIRTPIVSHHISKIEPSNSGRYKVDFIVKENRNSEALLPDSYFLDIDVAGKTADFDRRTIPNANLTFDISLNLISSIDMNKDFTVVGCRICNSNKGTIFIYKDKFVREFVIEGKSGTN